MAQISTHTGDDGTTGLLGPERVAKDDQRIEALGALDEAQSALGLARAFAGPAAAERLLDIQRQLYRLMGELSTSGQPRGEETARTYEMWTDAAQVDALDKDIETWRVTVPGQFIIPGASPFDGAVHFGRALVRRAERRVVALQRGGQLTNPQSLRFLNRLSDWLFVFAQHEASQPPVAARVRKRRSKTTKPAE